MFKVIFYFFIVVFLSACDFGKKDEAVPSPGLIPPFTDVPSPGLDPRFDFVLNVSLCFMDITLSEVRRSQKKISCYNRRRIEKDLC